jgi:hypothetical protein
LHLLQLIENSLQGDMKAETQIAAQVGEGAVVAGNAERM